MTTSRTSGPRTAGALGTILVALTASACALLPGSSSSCPETIVDGGLTQGIDLAVPGWVPTGFPLPDRLSIFLLDENYLDGSSFITGFVADADPGAILETLRNDLEKGGYETLLAADGFVPIAHDAIVVFNDRSEVLVTLGMADQQAPVRVSDDNCPNMPGTLVSMKFEKVEAEAARARYAGSFLTQGAAEATIGKTDFSSIGECLVFGNSYGFSSTSGDLIGLGLEASESGSVGFASVNSDSAVFNLDPVADPSVAPKYEVSESGFSVEGLFIDGLGDEGVVEGRVVVTCD